MAVAYSKAYISGGLVIGQGLQYLWMNDGFGYYVRFTHKLQTYFADLKFRSAKNKVTALPVTGAPLSALGILTPHNAKNRCVSQNKRFQNYTKTSIQCTYK